MKKKLIHTLVVAALSSAPMIASAELTGNVGLSSDYVWRGLTQTEGDSAISGGLDYSAPFGLSAGIWASNTALSNPDHPTDPDKTSPELDLYVGYAREFGDFAVSVGYIGYLYPGFEDDPTTTATDESNDLNWTEASVGFSWKMLSLTYNFSDDTFNSGTDSSYIDLGAEFEVAKDLTLSVHVGKYDFDADDVFAPINNPNEKFVWDDYTDYSISLSKGDFTITYSDTNLADDTVDDVAVNAAAYGGDEDFYSLDDSYKVYVSYTKEF